MLLKIFTSLDQLAVCNTVVYMHLPLKGSEVKRVCMVHS